MIVRVLDQMEPKTSPSRSIAAIVETRFWENSHRALRGITCKYDGGVLLLEGRLKSFYHTQLAQEIAANVEGVEQVMNHIEVVGRLKTA